MSQHGNEPDNGIAGANANVNPNNAALGFKLSELFCLIPEYDGDKILLNSFLTSCETALDIANDNQKGLVLVNIKNKLRGRASQIINSRNLNTFNEIQVLLQTHFGDSRDLNSLINDLHRMRQLPNDTPLTFANKISTFSSKLHASINSQNILEAQKQSQRDMIDNMCLDTLLTGLNHKIAPIIRASNPNNLYEATIRIKRELQLTYFEENKRYQNYSQSSNFNRNDNFNRSNNFNRNNNFNHSNNLSRNNNFNPNKNFNNKNTFPSNKNQSFNDYWEENFFKPGFLHNEIKRATRNYVPEPVNRNFNRSKTCSYCNKIGHIRADCFKLKREANNNNLNFKRGENVGKSTPTTNALYENPKPSTSKEKTQF